MRSANSLMQLRRRLYVLLYVLHRYYPKSSDTDATTGDRWLPNAERLHSSVWHTSYVCGYCLQHATACTLKLIRSISLAS
jgi:hypothetical protein